MADISSRVQESLSVSGILLGKTMGRTEELARRFETESGRLAELEVRSRMTGRWMMASIQTSFAVMPALVYLFAGHFAGSVSLGTVIAFTTLQARLFFPIGSLLGVGLEVQTSLALFDRVFEYLDQPVDIEEGTHARRPPRRRRLPRRLLPLRARPVDALRRLVRRTTRLEDGARRRDRLRQDDCGLPGRAPLRRHPRHRHDRRPRRPRAHLPVARERGRRRQPGDVPLPRERPRQPLRFARPDATDEEVEEAARAAQIHELITGLRTVTRPSSASVATASRAVSGSGSRSRGRSTQPPILVLDEATSRARHADGARRPGRAQAPGRRPDDDRDRPPALDRPRRRPDRGARPRSRRRDRHARGAAGRGWPLRRARLPRRFCRRMMSVGSGRSSRKSGPLAAD